MTPLIPRRTISSMMTSRPAYRPILISLACLVLSACAAPAFKNLGNVDAILPIDVQQSPDRTIGAEVVWGGRIVGVKNEETSTEVEIVGYPLDRDQQPVPDAPTVGRFILVLPGFVEPFDYPAGRHLSVHGRVSGARMGYLEEHDYLFPLLRAQEVTVWPWGFMLDKKPQVSIGVGVRIH